MKNLLIILLSACVGALLSMMLMRSSQQPEPPLPEMKIVRDTVIDVQIDTQYFPKPVPYKVEVRDTVYLDKPYNGYVFTQETKWYSDNSTYDMQVSGINVQLDWIKTYPKIVREVITETKTETIYVTPKPLSFWISAKYRQIGKDNSLPLTIEARYSKKNEEYFISGGYDLLQNNKAIEFGVSRRFEF